MSVQKSQWGPPELRIDVIAILMYGCALRLDDHCYVHIPHLDIVDGIDDVTTTLSV